LLHITWFPFNSCMTYLTAMHIPLYLPDQTDELSDIVHCAGDML
jgi:hypothetical protein